MPESTLRAWLDEVAAGRLGRRAFVQRLAALGVPPALALPLLPQAAHAQSAAPQPAYAPTRRGGGGLLKLLMWQGPTILNPHFSTGVKDNEGSAIFYQCLATYDGDGNLLPILADEIPSRANGGIAADGRSVTWKLKKGVRWHDGAPFTADDVVFNFQFATDPATASTRAGVYRDLKVVRVDAHTVRIDFDSPRPLWYATCAVPLVPRHVFAPFMGAKAREAAANLRPVGTGAYRITDFRPGDLLRAEANPDYHQGPRPHFDALELKGGGDATSAARAVLQTGEFDWAWNLLVEDEVLQRMEASGKGVVETAMAGTVEYILLNHADPWTEVDGERASPRSRHPVLGDAAVREALSLLLDRQNIQDHIFGRGGPLTPNVLVNPPRFRSPNLRHEFDIAKANAVLDAAGWKRGAGGVREKDGRRLKFVYQTSTNSARQKTQVVVKQAMQQAGIDVELKAVQGSVFFSADPGNPDTNQRFQADLQQYANSMGDPDPHRFMDQFTSAEITGRHNGWRGRNVTRWRDDEYDRLHAAARSELDPVRRVALFVAMNDRVVRSRWVLPLVMRPSVSGRSRTLAAPVSGWGDQLAWLPHWHRRG